MSSTTRKDTTPPPFQLSRRLSVAKSSPRPKGLNLNTVSPSPNLKHSCTPDTYGPQSWHELVHSFEYDVSIPPPQELEKISLNEQLRYLALKEMSVVEINDAINTLKGKLQEAEDDVASLRRVVQQSLFRETRLNSPATPSELETGSRIWNNLSKPLTFIQQLDSLINTEFEKALALDQQDTLHAHPKGQHTIKRPSRAAPSPLRDKSNTMTRENHKSLAVDDDMFHTVSSSIWLFVNDVKTNIISSQDEKAPTCEVITTPKLPCTKKNSKPSMTRGISQTALKTSTGKPTSDEDKVDLSIYSSMRRGKRVQRD